MASGVWLGRRQTDRSGADRVGGVLASTGWGDAHMARPERAAARERPLRRRRRRRPCPGRLRPTSVSTYGGLDCLTGSLPARVQLQRQAGRDTTISSWSSEHLNSSAFV
uniref:Uncharacterized protein n=1 Tax=Setaria italica TaxID=4555 RepID=K3Y4B4_SETIT